MREFFLHACKPLALLACLAAPVAFAAPKITNVQIVDETGNALSDETFAEGETVTFEVTFDTVLNTQESELANFRLVLNYPKTNVDSAEYSAVYAANGARVAGSPSKLRFTYTVRPGDIVTGLHATSTSGTLSFAGLSSQTPEFAYGTYDDQGQNIKIAGWDFNLPVAKAIPVCVTTLTFRTEGNLPGKTTSSAKPRKIRLWTTSANVAILDGEVSGQTSILTAGANGQPGEIAVRVAFYGAGTYPFYMNDGREAQPALNDQAIALGSVSVKQTTFVGDDGNPHNLFSQDAWNYFTLTIKNGEDNKVPRGDSVTATLACYLPDSFFAANGPLALDLAFANASVAHSPKSDVVFTQYGQTITLTLTGSRNATQTENTVGLVPSGSTGADFTSPSGTPASNLYILPQVLTAAGTTIYGELSVGEVLKEFELLYNGNPIPAEGLYYNEGEILTNLTVRVPTAVSSPMTLAVTTLDASGSASSGVVQASPATVTIATGETLSTAFNVLIANGDSTGTIRITQRTVPIAYKALDIPVNTYNVDPEATLTSPLQTDFAPLQTIQFRATFKDVLADNVYCYIDYGDGNHEQVTLTGRRDSTGSINGLAPWANFSLSANHAYSNGGKTYQWTIYYTDTFTSWDDHANWPALTGSAVISAPRYLHVIKRGSGDGTVAAVTAGDATKNDILDGTSKVSGSDNRTLLFPFAADASNVVNSCVLSAFPYSAAFTTSGRTEAQAESSSDKANYFCAWLWPSEFQVSGDEAGKITAYDNPNSVTVSFPEAQNNGGSYPDITLYALFSGEYIEGDGVGDYDKDGLPDFWEKLYWEVTPNAQTDALFKPGNAADNDDGDCFPEAGVSWLWPSGGTSFLPTGLPFSNLLEARGVVPEEESIEEFGIKIPEEPWETSPYLPGTDPTKEDTSGDGYLDGWKYYFWNIAKNDPEAANHFKKYDPTWQNPEGLPIDPAEVVDAFEPAKLLSHAGDPDNDGLTNFEEYTLGTNPLHFDTDGDGLSDGYEVAMSSEGFELNPLVSDASGNPDGDAMAYATSVFSEEEARDNNGLLPLVSNGDGEVYFIYAVDPTAFFVDDNDVVWNLDAGPLPDTVRENGIIFKAFKYGVYDDSSIYASLEIVDPALYDQFEATGGAAPCAVIHGLVLDAFGFDPRTGWAVSGDQVVRPDGVPAGNPNTKAYSTLDEYLLFQYTYRGMGGAFSIAANATGSDNGIPTRTNPGTPDTDGDKAPDGWELYTGYNPCDGEDGSLKTDGKLTVATEFAGMQSSAAYNFENPHVADGWLNKFWPTDPRNPILHPEARDTDGDGVPDNVEGQIFIHPQGETDMAHRDYEKLFKEIPNFYTAETSEFYRLRDAYKLIVYGGGLNPCCIDTDGDLIPDNYEAAQAQIFDPDRKDWRNAKTGCYGMDGTVDDGMADYDHDGLLNYQEYMVGAMRHFRYDIGTNEVPLDFVSGSAPGLIGDGLDGGRLFTTAKSWDECGRGGFLLPAFYLRDSYASTDVWTPDSDNDGMDDYYEMFHGLNPILGSGSFDSDKIAQEELVWNERLMTYKNNPIWDDTHDDTLMDFKKYPWTAGMSIADPDMDGIINLDEAISANSYESANYHSDPTPAWMTDPSYAASYVSRFYQLSSFRGIFAGPPFTPVYWIGAGDQPMFHPTDSQFLYSFEVNEGFDTDGSGLSDKEKVASGKDPIDHYDNGSPRRQAMWFDGVNSALCTPSNLPLFPSTSSLFTSRDYYQALRNYTVELWVRPEETSREQVIIERPCVYPSSNEPQGNADRVRYTFRIGIQQGGALFAEFDGAGSSEAVTEKLVCGSTTLKPNEWAHVAAVVNGYAKRFELYVNGSLAAYKTTSLIPANGVYASSIIPDQGPTNELDLSTSELIQIPAYFSEHVYAPLNVGGSVGRDPQAVFYIENGVDRTDTILGRLVCTNFFKGYVDQIRIWNGARTAAEIAANYTRRFSRADALANRDEVSIAAYKALMEDQQAALDVELPAALFFHYSFDNFFSTGLNAAGTNQTDAPVLTAPKGWAATQTPADYLPTVLTMSPNTSYSLLYGAGVPTGPSTVYPVRQYVPMAQNMIGHLPFRGAVTNNLVINNDEVLDSRFWAHTHAGVNSNGVFRFPNAASPYGMWWVHDNHESITTFDSPVTMVSKPRTGSEVAGLNLTGDLIPLGNAWAKPVADGWDGAGPVGGSWSALDNSDSNGNGLPDWFIAQHGGNPAQTDRTASDYIGWTMVDSETGKTYGQLYLEFIANGNTTDSDGDGLPDWWENFFGLDPLDPEGDNGPYGDPDGDGLNNYAEYLAWLNPFLFSTYEDQIADAFHYLNNVNYTLGLLLSDSDYVEDSFEALYSSRFADPWASDGTVDADNDGWDLWSEARFARGYRHSTNPTVGSDASGDQAPIPAIALNVSFATSREVALSNSTLVVWGYSGNNARDQQNAPNAVWTIPLGVSSSNTVSLGTVRVDTKVRGVLPPGNLLPGSVVISTEESQVGIDENGTVTTQLVKVAVAKDNGKGQFLRVSNNDTVGQVDYTAGTYSGLNLSFLAEGTEASISYDAATPATAASPFTVLLEKPDSGRLDQGPASFFVFLDEDGDGLWTWEADPYAGAREVAGIPAPSGRASWKSGSVAETDFTHTIGWDGTQLNVSLTDRATGFIRYTWADAEMGSESNLTEDAVWDFRAYRVEGTNGVENAPYFAKRFPKWKTFIHEGDFYTYGQFGMECQTGFVNPPSFKTNVSYLIVINGITNGIYNMNYPLGQKITGSTVAQDQPDRIRPTALAPINGERIVRSRPTFRWEALEGATAFKLTITHDGTKVYDSNFQNMPQVVKISTSANGSGVPLYTYEWTPPLASGLSNAGNLADGDYTWTVTHYAPWAQSGYASTAGKFTLSTKEYYDAAAAGKPVSTTFGFADVSVRYAPVKDLSLGLATTLRVEAYEHADFAGEPVAGATQAGAGSTLTNTAYTTGIDLSVLGLEAGKDYFLLAYVDIDANGKRDAGEPWGYVRRLGQKNWQNDPVPVTASFAKTKAVELWIQDVDTDNDGLSDTYELKQKGNLSTLGYNSTVSRSQVISAVMAYSVGGLSVLSRSDLALPAVQLAVAGSVSDSALASGEAIVSPAVVVDGFSTASDGTPTISWRFGNASRLDVSAGGEGQAASVTPVDTVLVYVLERRLSLTEGDWEEVSRATSVSGLNTTAVPTDAPAAFFRIRVIEYVK